MGDLYRGFTVLVWISVEWYLKIPSVCGPFSFSTASVRASMTQGRVWSGNLALCSSITSSRVVANIEGLNGASCEGVRGGDEGRRGEGVRM